MAAFTNYVIHYAHLLNRLQYKQFMDEFQKIINQVEYKGVKSDFLTTFFKVLSDYEQLVKARASGYPEQKLKMLELQKKRMYEKRILDLSNQIENLQQNYRTLSAKLNGLANKYNPKVHYYMHLNFSYYFFFYTKATNRYSNLQRGGEY